MSLLLRRPLIAAVVGALLALAIVAGVAWAKSDQPPEVAFTGCLDLTSGKVSSVALGEDPAFPCTNDLQQVSWLGEAVIGINGENGKDGDKGDSGDEGAAGVVGNPGIPGINGTNGATGATGPQGLFGPTGPTGASGALGPAGAAGPPGSTGGPGPKGDSGNVIRSGTGVPAAGLGDPGDLYRDLAATVLYGPKSTTGWPTPGLPLSGDDGREFLSGEGDPNSLGTDIGVPGDLYIDTTNNLLWGPKAADGSWPQRAQLQGTDGNTILSGTDADPPTVGVKDGDFYLDITDHILYGPATVDAEGNAIWPKPGKVLAGASGEHGQDGEDGQDGADGQDGEDGQHGADGNTVHSGSLQGVSVPPADVGAENDFFLQVETSQTPPLYVMWGPKTADPTFPWGASGTVLNGPPGPPGAQAMGFFSTPTAFSIPPSFPGPGALVVVAQVDIDAPSDGAVVLNASARVIIVNALVECGISRSPTAFDDGTSQWSPLAVLTVLTDYLSLTKGYDVQAGLNSFYLLCRAENIPLFGGTATADHRNFTATFAGS